MIPHSRLVHWSGKILIKYYPLEAGSCLHCGHRAKPEQQREQRSSTSMRSRPGLHLAASRAIWGIVREHAIGPSCSSAYPRPVNEALGYRAADLASSSAAFARRAGRVRQIAEHHGNVAALAGRFGCRRHRRRQASIPMGLRALSSPGQPAERRSRREARGGGRPGRRPNPSSPRPSGSAEPSR
jgi:hypothetical protein